MRSKAQSCLGETSPHAHLFRLPLGVALVVGMSLLACGGDSGGGAESPASLGIVAEPAGGFTGRALPVQPVVELRRPSGARATEASAEVVATITSGRGALSGTTRVTTVHGVATFTDLRITGSGPHVLEFASAGLPSVNSRSVTVSVPTCRTGSPPATRLPTQVPSFRPSSPGELDQSASPGIVQVPGSGAMFASVVPLPDGSGPAILAGMGTYPPVPKADVSLRLLRPAGGQLVDVTLAYMTSVPRRVHPRHAVVGDFNGDGRPDLFIAAHGYDTAPYMGERNVLLLSNSSGTWDDRSDLLPVEPDFSHSATAADIDRSGHLSIYVGNLGGNTGQTRPYFLVGDGTGHFTQDASRVPFPTIASSQDYYNATLLFDVDNDGAPDLILGGMDGREDSVVLLNDGAGRFPVRQVLPPGGFSAVCNLDYLPVDIDQDGCTDLVLSQTQWSPMYVGHAIQVLMNQGDGTFRDESSRLGDGYFSTSGYWVQFLRSLDVNHDGRMDIFAEGIFENGLSPTAVLAWLSQGDGTFLPMTLSALGKTGPDLPPWSQYLVPLDVDGDGKVDVVEVWTAASGAVAYRVFRQQ